MNTNLHIISTALLDVYIKAIDSSIEKKLNALQDSELSIDSFSFYTSVSAVFSSKIEGENIELDSYVKHKRFGIEFLPDYTRKTDDLYNAYIYAQNNRLTAENIFHIHSLITENILPQNARGKFRNSAMFVTTTDGKIEYVATEQRLVASEFEKLTRDISTLLHTNLTTPEVFFYAAWIHLVFVKTHPFEDGNGRTARLLEKWFIAEKLGEKAWFLSSEKHYYEHHATYYKNLRVLGLEYDTLNYSNALPFLTMLPNCF